MRTLLWWAIAVAWWIAALALFPITDTDHTDHGWHIAAGLGWALAFLAGWLFPGLPRARFWLSPIILLALIAAFALGYAWHGAIDHTPTVEQPAFAWMVVPAFAVVDFVLFLIGYGLSSVRRALF
ncbi:hypothetical protein [Hamadaea tsunoensis]|uniref:hypothetical protein n=1 Tax=Hamadaea tsunoensis TaxID=53368 RepID=UPI0012FB84EC|nr:hypothetical protein [Hamadaea tsunoensis]